MAVVAVAGVNAFNANSAKTQRVDMILSDVEQLAEGEHLYNAPCMWDPNWLYCRKTYNGTVVCMGDLLC